MDHATLAGVLAESAVFVRASLAHADLRGARLAGADCTDAILRFADLTDASAAYATFENASLVSARLAGADLANVELAMANLDGAVLAGARVHGASFYRTLLTGCADLAQAIGLEETVHRGPSALDLATLRAATSLPSAFLEGVGLPADFLEAIRPLQAQR
jgi:uncharacterized protein YjbI with pentapeptide repeats